MDRPTRLISQLFFPPITPRGNGLGAAGFAQNSYDNYEGLTLDPPVTDPNNPGTGAGGNPTAPDLTQQGNPQGQTLPPTQPPTNPDGTPAPLTPPTPQGGDGTTPPAAPPTTPPATPPVNTEGGTPPTEAELDALQAQAQAAIAPLIEAGIYRPEPDKPYDLTTDEGMIELGRDTARANFRDVVLEIPEAQREFVIAAINGATREEMRQLALIDATLPDYSQYDLAKPEHVSAILMAKATTELGEGATADEIKDLVNTYESLPDAAKRRMAETGKAGLIADVNRQRQSVSTQAAARQASEAVAEQARITSEITTIRGLQNIGKMPVTSQDREALIAFMYTRDAEGKTAQERSASLENKIAQAFYLMKGFDLSKTAGRAAGNILSQISRIGNRTGIATNAPTTGANRDQVQQIEQNLANLETSNENYRPMNLR